MYQLDTFLVCFYFCFFLELKVVRFICIERNGQAVSLMLCDRTKKKMTFVGLEPTPSAIRADVLS